MGKLSQKYGQQLENYLDRLHSLYYAQGRAFLFKVPTPLQIKGPLMGTKLVKAAKLKAVFVDYAGTLDGGISVALESKCHTSGGPSYPFGKMPQHQRDTLTMVHTLGGIAALYVRRVHGMTVEDYLVPAVWIDAHPRKSFKWTEVEKFKVPSGKGWLDCAPSCVYDNRETDWAAYCDYGWKEYKWCPYDGMGRG